MANAPGPAPIWQDEFLGGLQDPRLKPRLLHSLLAHQLPDDDQESVVPANLACAVDTIRRHKLLQEPPMVGLAVGGQNDPRKISVDVWITRVMKLLANTKAINRWAGACLLGVTCSECSKQRFVDSWSLWMKDLLPLLKKPVPDGSSREFSDPIQYAIKGAACCALKDLLTRLGRSNVKRDGAMAARLWTPLSSILADDVARPYWGDVADLICAMLSTFPGSLRSHCDAVETALMAKLLDVDCIPPLQKKLCQCLALLSRAMGDSGSWSSYLRRILIAINTDLKLIFWGMEDATLASSWESVLLPPGQPAPPSFGGPLPEVTLLGSVDSVVLHQRILRVLILLQTSSLLFTTSYPTPVVMPLGQILALATRIVRVDGSLKDSNQGAAAARPSADHQGALCAELPKLHLAALKLLMSVLQGARSAVVPVLADVAKLLSDSFRRPSFSTTFRICLYQTTSHYLTSFGAGFVLVMAPVVVKQALSDLNNAAPDLFSPRLKTPGGGLGIDGLHTPPGPGRKRKEPGGVPDHFGGPNSPEWSLQTIHNNVSVELQMAALVALETLLTMGGAFLPAKYRDVLDRVLVTIAMTAVVMDLPATNGEMESSGASKELMQVTACRALLSSLLAPSTHRPPFLGQAFHVFKRGRQAAGTSLATFCSHAMLALEPFLHPFCLPTQASPLIHANPSSGQQSTPGNSSQNRAAPSTLPPLGTTLSSRLGAAMGLTGHGAATGGEAGGLDEWQEVDDWFGFADDFDMSMFEGLAGVVGEGSTRETGVPASSIDPETAAIAGQQMHSLASEAGLFAGLRPANAQPLVPAAPPMPYVAVMGDGHLHNARASNHAAASGYSTAFGQVGTMNMGTSLETGSSRRSLEALALMQATSAGHLSQSTDPNMHLVKQAAAILGLGQGDTRKSEEIVQKRLANATQQSPSFDVFGSAPPVRDGGFGQSPPVHRRRPSNLANVVVPTPITAIPGGTIIEGGPSRVAPDDAEGTVTSTMQACLEAINVAATDDWRRFAIMKVLQSGTVRGLQEAGEDGLSNSLASKRPPLQQLAGSNSSEEPQAVADSGPNGAGGAGRYSGLGGEHNAVDLESDSDGPLPDIIDDAV